jgi:hypothetical protein
VTLRSLLAVTVCILGCFPAWGEDELKFTPDQLEFFEKQVRPILVARCYECHSSKLKEPKGGLRLDSRAGLLKGGDTEPAIVPGNAKKSLLVDAINYGDKFQMPKKSKMPADEIAVLTKWVDLGAPWTPGDKPETAETKVFDLAARKAAHWCWQPLSNPPVPQVKNAAWPASAVGDAASVPVPTLAASATIDRFILAKLEDKGFAPAAPAEKRTLLRRVHFDLTGLPPTPPQINAFLADNSPDALAKVIDELLKSPAYGERWGRHWLDLVRYAESRGHEFDYNSPNAYQYRDYVIRALNEDLPYNDFVVEHVAGDLLEKPRLSKDPSPLSKQGNGSPLHFNESILGTGFWFLGEWIHSPVDIRKDECDRFDNMVDVFSKTFLGLTVSCARCHDHKFDAISQADYYALFGYLQSSSYRLVRFDTMLEEERIAKELEELDRNYEDELLKAMSDSQLDSVKKIDKYLVASYHVIRKKLEEDAVAAYAKENSFDAELLKRWVKRIREVKDRPGLPLYFWAQLCLAADDDEEKMVQATLKKVGAENDERIKRRNEQLKKFSVVADHGGFLIDKPRPFRLRDALIIFGSMPLPKSEPTRWMQNGVSFYRGPNDVGPLFSGLEARLPDFDSHSTVATNVAFRSLRAAPGAEPEPGRLANFDRAGKTIRTPTFTIDKGPVHYLVKGRGHAYAAVNSHSTLAGPLHGQLVVDFNQGDGAERWVTHDLSAYAGQKVHIEFTPAKDSDLEIGLVGQGVRPEILPHGSFMPFSGSSRVKTTVENCAKEYVSTLLEYPEVIPLILWNHRDLVPDDESKTKDVFARYAAERKKLTDQIRPESRYAMAMWDGTPEDESLLIRGNPHSPGQVVPRRMLEALGGKSDLARSASEGSGRLQLARELVDAKKNPLVPRVIVNRVWHHLFGRGIVPSVDNFGVLGQAPTHPELLDHLATRFVNDGWSLKRLIRTIMLSRAYQMSSSLADAKVEEADPKNLLWRRTNVRRLEGEAIRDELLAISGRLDKTMYGPSVPVHLTAFLQGRGRPGDGPLDGNGRRSIYLSIRRNFLSPMMIAFDAPIPFSTMGARNVSNVPAQALILMNDPFVVQQAELWAKKVLAEPNRTPEQRIAAMYESAYGRAASDEEIAAALGFLQSQAKEYGLPPDAVASDLRVWTDLAHVLVNAKEFIFLN